jgi:hypothetical protein
MVSFFGGDRVCKPSENNIVEQMLILVLKGCDLCSQIKISWNSEMKDNQIARMKKINNCLHDGKAA